MGAATGPRAAQDRKSAELGGKTPLRQQPSPAAAVPTIAASNSGDGVAAVAVEATAPAEAAAADDTEDWGVEGVDWFWEEDGKDKSSETASTAASASAAYVFLETVSPQQRDLASQVRAISSEAFGEDAMQTHRGERVAVLTFGDEVVAYASYVCRQQLGSLNVNKLAVSRTRRRQGLGRRLIRQLVQLARQRPVAPKQGRVKQAAPPLEVVCLSALPTAVDFYRACGFREERAVRLPEEDGEELVEGQVYMEYGLSRKRRPR